MKKKTVTLKEGIKLRCQHCWHNWRYCGASESYCSCPLCHYKVNIRKARSLYLQYLRNVRANAKIHLAKQKAHKTKGKSKAKKSKAKAKRKVSK